MTTPADPSRSSGADLVARLHADAAKLDLELAEIDMLVGQARTEAARHEQKRVQASERIAAMERTPDAAETAEAYTQLVALTRRAVLMESQVDVLDGKRRALTRHREALEAAAAAIAAASDPASSGPDDQGAPAGSMTPSLSRVILGAQEDLRREIARAMHDGPAQSLTNIVLQAEIVERLVGRDPDQAKGELRLLVSMVQQTLEATKSFIFDVRPMVLDDLGLVPTLRRASRERGRRTRVPVEFDSLGQDRRLPMEVESTIFRILDEAIVAYLSLAPERIVLRLDWSDVLEARLSAHRTVVLPVEAEPLPEVPRGADVPDAIKQMIQDRHDARRAAVDAAHEAAVVILPASARRDVVERAASIGATLEVLGGDGALRLVVPLPPEAGATAGT